MPTQENILDLPALSLSDADHLRLRDLVEGTLITGAPGSGKTTTSGKQLACALLRTPNTGRAGAHRQGGGNANWIAYAKACGREKDLIVFNAESGHASILCITSSRGPGAAPATWRASSISSRPWFPSVTKKLGTAMIRSGNEEMSRSCAIASSCSNSPGSESRSPASTG